LVGQFASKAVGWYVGADVPQKGQYEEEGKEAEEREGAGKEQVRVEGKKNE
jgi:hypothetical protein